MPGGLIESSISPHDTVGRLLLAPEMQNDERSGDAPSVRAKRRSKADEACSQSR